MQENRATYHASFRELQLQIWEAEGGYAWSVANPATGEVTQRGESADRESAMVDAAQAAGADWGSVRWRGSAEEDDDDDE